MRRREFLAGVATTTAMPLATRAQERVPRVGVMTGGTSETMGRRIAAFTQRLREFGWIDGRTVAIEYRWTQGSRERATEIATEFARINVDVIVASGTPLVMAARQATTVIPIVFANAADPVGSGLVASLARPGGNITGLSNQQADTSTKRLALLPELIPGLRRIGFMGNTDNPPILLEMREVQGAARGLGLECENFEIRQARDIGPAFDAVRGRGWRGPTWSSRRC